MTWNVCLVTDNAAIRHLFEKTFEKRKDLSLTVCTSAEETREAIKNTPPHIMIVSVNLPDGDGYDLCGELKGKGASFPILLIEDIFEDIDLDRCLEARADGFISKPFEEDLIEEKVNEVLESLAAPEREEATEKGDGEETRKKIKEPLSPPEGESAEAIPSEPPDEEAAKEDEGIIDLTDLLMEEEAESPGGKSDGEGISEEESDVPQEKEASGEVSPEEEMPVSETATFEDLGEIPLDEEVLQEIPLEETLEEEVVPPLEEEKSALADTSEEVEVPPFIASVLEESAHELEKMEAMEPGEAPPLSEEETPTESLEKPEVTSPVSALREEELETKIREVVDISVRNALESRLPGILKESLSRLLAEISATLK